MSCADNIAETDHFNQRCKRVDTKIDSLLTGLGTSKRDPKSVVSGDRSVRGAVDADAQSTAPASKQPVDTSSVSDSARIISDAESRLGKEPYFDADRVADLAERIRGGEFKVDAASLAKRLVDFELDIYR